MIKSQPWLERRREYLAAKGRGQNVIPFPVTRLARAAVAVNLGGTDTVGCFNAKKGGTAESISAGPSGAAIEVSAPDYYGGEAC